MRKELQHNDSEHDDNLAAEIEHNHLYISHYCENEPSNELSQQI